MNQKMAGRVNNSLLFIGAGLLLGFVSLVAFAFVAKEKVKKRRPTGGAHAFLADKKRALAYYDALSPVYDLLNPYLYTLSMRGEIMKLVNGDQALRVLDVGCGTGYTTGGLLRLHSLCEVVGVDQNHKQLQKAAKNLRLEKARTSLSRGDAENLPFRDEAFDAVVSVGAVEYLPDPERALKEMARVVKHGGRVVVGGPEFDWFKKLFLHRVFYAPAAQDFKSIFYRAGLQTMKTVLTGVNTFFSTNKYVLVVAGTREYTSQSNNEVW
jgi:ubiquinone/menaquinone biosynthesis C-methylase UbiE